jgi:hypothetical protein
VVDAIIDDLYTQIRTAVFHAKKGHIVLLPQDDTERDRVADALQRYVGLYTRVAEVVLRTRFFQTAIGPIVVERIGELLARQTVGLSDRAFVGLKDYDEAAASALIPLPTRRAPEYDGSFRAAVLGTAEVSSLPPDLVIRSVGMPMEDGKPATIESFGGALELSGVGTIEALVTFRGSGAGARTLYDT